MKIEDVRIRDSVEWFYEDNRGGVKKTLRHVGLVSRIGQKFVQVECEDGRPRKVYASSVRLLDETQTPEVGIGDN